MLSWASLKKLKEGFVDSAALGTAGLQTFLSNTLQNPLPTTDMGLPLEAITTTVNTRPSGVATKIDNNRLANIKFSNPPTASRAAVKAGIPTDTFAARQAACEATGNGDQFDHLSSLAANQDPSSKMRCGWVYDNNNPANGRGAYGTIDGPFQTTAKGAWMWDLNAAQKKYHSQICSQVKNCQDLDASFYGGRCGWNTQAGKAVPIKNGAIAYPNDPRLSCSSSNLVSSGANCPPPPPPAVIIDDNGNSVAVATPASICTPLANGHLSRNCLIQKVTDAGCSDKGALVNALRSGSDSNYIDQLSRSDAYKTYQQRATSNLNEASLRSGGYDTTANALNDFKNVNDLASANLETGLGYAARDLCFNKGTLDTFDFCTELNDATPPPFDLACVQKAFLRAGGQKTGTKYPNSAAPWNAMPNWKAVKDTIQKLMASARAEGFTSAERASVARKNQEEAMQSFYGVTLESKSDIPKAYVSNKYSGPKVAVHQNCDNSSGWKRELDGLGIFLAGNGFPGDASYITVPAGLMAIVTASNGSSQTVIGPSEFNFCSRGGFNDSVSKIEVAAVGKSVSGPENGPANLKCDSGTITGMNYKYGQWPNGISTEKIILGRDLPNNCAGNTECTINLGNNWGDPMSGTYKKYVATPLCSESEKKYDYRGCWGDAGNPNQVPPNERALPVALGYGNGNVTSVDQCYGLASANGYKNFGVQYGGQCWAGNNEDWKRYGGIPEDSCGDLGTTLNNKVHTIRKKTKNTQNVYGNNGSVSCDMYCNGINNGPWNGELPREWNGAKCIGTPANPAIGCKSGHSSALVCTCERTGTGWSTWNPGW